MKGYCETSDESRTILHSECRECRDWKPIVPQEKCTCYAALMDGKGCILHDKYKSESQQRKETPIWSGLLQYFPLACEAVARLSFKANEKHNPGELMHWAREKSKDHEDCIIRHSMNPAEIDPEFGELHAVARAWRAMAALELLEEKRLVAAGIKPLSGVIAQVPTPPVVETDWIPWAGGTCPVPRSTLVDIKFRGTFKNESNSRAGVWDWIHCGKDGDVIAYRVVRTPPVV